MATTSIVINLEDSHHQGINIPEASNIAHSVNVIVEPLNIEGTSDSDSLTGTAADDTINGNDGDDLISGQAGNDTINGEAGNNDRMFGDDGDDTITDPDGVLGAHGGAGDDTITVTFASSWDNNFNPNDNPRSDGKITGGYGNDIITVTMSSDRFFINLKGDEPVSPISNAPQDGDDVITLQGNYANSVVDLGAGDDIFNGGEGSDNVSGSGGNDIIIGSSGNDGLAGNEGDDILNGGTGNDWLTGGTGDDQFIYTEVRDGGDIITDFGNGNDVLNLTALFEGLGTDPITESYIQLLQIGADTQVQIDPDGLIGASAFSTLVTLNNSLVEQLAIGGNILV